MRGEGILVISGWALFLIGCGKHVEHKQPLLEQSALTVRHLTIVDDSNHPRIILGMSGSKSTSYPEIKILDKEGNEAVTLQLNSKDEGRIIFSSKSVDGAEVVGSLPLGDTEDQHKTIWGLRVLDPTSDKAPVKVLP